MHGDGASLFVAQRLNSDAHPPMRSPSTKPETVSPRRSAAGFLLLDSSLRPIAFNPETLLLAGKIRQRLLSPQPSRESPLVTEFRSGRRRYLCRAFLVDSDVKGPSQASIAVLLERAPLGLIPLSPVSEQFNLTRRERDALEYLLQGLSNKEIAHRMNVSPNTVKAFLRLIMLKMEVSSRAAIVAKVMMTNP